jgi:hypothetical protein
MQVAVLSSFGSIQIAGADAAREALRTRRRR